MEDNSWLSLETLLGKVSELLKVIENRKSPLVIGEKLAADIEKLATASSDFKEAVETLFKMARITPLELEQKLEDAGGMRRSDKQTVQQAKDLQIEGAVMNHVLEEEKKRRRKNGPRREGEPLNENKQRMKERKKLFKTIGGDKNWIPL